MTTVNVERTEVLKTGTNKRTGRPWTLFQVIGTYADGSPLQDVKTFDMLGVGPAEVTLSADERTPGGYVLSTGRKDARNDRTPQPQSRSNVANPNLEDRVSALEDAVRKLNKQLSYIITNPDIDLPDA